MSEEAVKVPTWAYEHLGLNALRLQQERDAEESLGWGGGELNERISN